MSKIYLYQDIKDKQHDASGINEPSIYYWEQTNGIFYPTEKLTEDQCHSETSEWIHENNFPASSLDEISLDIFSPEQRIYRDFLMSLYDSSIFDRDVEKTIDQDSYDLTNYIIVSNFESWRNLNEDTNKIPTLINYLENTTGFMGFVETARKFTTEFETINIDNDYENDPFFEAVDAFLDTKFKHFEQLAPLAFRAKYKVMELLEELGEGWEDASWKNDEEDSIYNPSLDMSIYVLEAGGYAIVEGVNMAEHPTYHKDVVSINELKRELITLNK